MAEKKYVRKSLLCVEFEGFHPEPPSLCSDFVDKVMDYDENGNVIYHDRNFKEESDLKCSDFKLEVILKTAPESLKQIDSPYSSNRLAAADRFETAVRGLDSIQDDAEYRERISELLRSGTETGTETGTQTGTETGTETGTDIDK